MADKKDTSKQKDAASSEPGDAGTSTPQGRLPSLRPSKDFTLGGKQKTQFMPTVPTKRNKKEPTTADQEKGGSSRGGRGGGRGGRGGRGGGMRGRVELSSTATGFLAMGPSNLAASRMGRFSGSSGGGGGGGGGGGAPGSAGAAMLDLDAAIKEGTASFPLDLWAPVAYDTVGGASTSQRSNQQNKGKSAARNAKTSAIAVKMEDDIDDSDGIKIKQEEDVLAMLQQEVTESATDDMEMHDDMIEDEETIPPPARNLLHPIIANNTQIFPRTSARDENLFFFQFPTVMPKFNPSINASTSFERNTQTDTATDVKMENESADTSMNDAVKVKSEKMDVDLTTTTTTTDDNSNDENTQTSNTASGSKSIEGLVGKLVVYKSGRMRLRLGTVEMDITDGANCAFPQEIAAIDESSKTISILGTVANRFVCTPNITHMLSNQNT
ncbi:RNA polymerase III RPC4-domain-containing protein [Syncephalis plumigaleata]|nr:RNA polymerase III RPC4-domain-containing protein [Syncephalis plumigaleata]